MKLGSPFSPQRGSPTRDTALRQTLAAAIAAIGAGQLAEAAKLIDSSALALKSPVGQNIRGDIFLKEGRLEDALRAFDAAIKLAPQMPEAHANRGVALQELGRLEEALAAQDRALRHRSGYATAHFNRGNVLKALGRFDDAVAAYGRALAAQPAFPEAALNRGLALVGNDQPLEALADFARALTLRPHYVAAHIGRATAHRELGDFAQSFAALDAALTIEPDNLDALLARGETLAAAERYGDALDHADALVLRQGDSGRVHALRATILRKLSRGADALAAAKEAVRVAPADVGSYNALGIALTEAGRLAEALGAFEKARELGGPVTEFQHYRALALGDLGDPAEAVEALNRVVTANPDDASARTNRGYLHLSLGNFRQGWADHESRGAVFKGKRQGPSTTPQWNGEDVTAKKILVMAEQGFGDTIQFTRFIPLLVERGARVTLSVPRALVRLYEDNFPGVDVTDVLGLRAGFDYQISVMSFPFAFGSTMETLPRNVPYLVADPERVAKWRARIGAHGFKVGIAWQGNPKYGRDHLRSIRASEFAPLAAVPGVRLISLQTARPAEQLKSLPAGMRVETLGEEIVDNPDGFREMAAAMEGLDLLITSDTGPAHLAGALGRPIWVALAARPDWRWMREGEVTPWYPTMRLVRQQAPGDWPGLFNRIAAELTPLAREAQ